MSFVEYLTSIDWLGALVLAAVLVVIGLIVLRFGLAATSEVGRMLPGAGRSAGQALLDARDLPPDSWVCSACRSVNTPNAHHCYRGCGPRDELARPLPSARESLGSIRDGRSTRT